MKTSTVYFNYLIYLIIFIVVCIIFYDQIVLRHACSYLNIGLETENVVLILNLNSKCNCRSGITYVTQSNVRDRIFTCGLYNTIRRGYGQKVVSYSLYGSDLKYYSEIKYLSQLVGKYYPEWIIRIYYDNSINKTIICELECLKDEATGKYMDNIDFCNINEIPSVNPVTTWNAQYMHSMTWRFLPIGDSFVDMFMSRDLDSWIVQREVDAVNVWLKSTTLFHVMRDNPQHGTAILGGMFGYANYRNRELGYKLYSKLIDKSIAQGYNDDGKSRKGNDQDFLGYYFWPHAKINGTVHDSYLCDKYGRQADPFPTQRPKTFCFVPCSFCCDETKYNQTWMYVCPQKCRPKDHQDWLYC